MTNHATESCPRCQTFFVCKVNDIRTCDCQQIDLSREETQYIRDLAMLNFNDNCFCVACLHELKAQSHSHTLITHLNV